MLTNPIDEDNLNNEYEASCLIRDLDSFNKSLLKNPKFIGKELLNEVFLSIGSVIVNHEGKRYNG